MYLVLCSLVTPDHNTSPDQCSFQKQIRALIPYGKRSDSLWRKKCYKQWL